MSCFHRLKVAGLTSISGYGVERGGGEDLDEPRGSEMVMLDITRDALAHGLCNLTVCSAYFLPIRTRGCQEENS